MGVTILPKGYSGPITVTLADPPPGPSERPGLIPAGGGAVPLPFRECRRGFSGDAAEAGGASPRHGRAVERLATKWLVYAEQNNVPMCNIDHFGLVAAPALAPPVTLETPRHLSKFPMDSAPFPSRWSARKGPTGPWRSQHCRLRRDWLYPRSVSRRKRRRQSHGDRGGGISLGTSTLVLQAKGKIGGAERD